MLRPQKILGPILSLFGLILVLAPQVRAENPAPDPPTIRRITIEGNVRTRTEVIRRELLFSEGEPLDSSLVAETERNLRRLYYLGRARIRVREADGAADVAVEVQDLYSRALSPWISGAPGELSYGLIALDYNLLGRGQIAEITVERDAVSGGYARAYYRAPRLLDSRHALTTTVGAGAEGHEAGATVSHPYYSLSTQWSYGLSLNTRQRIERLYTSQILTHRYSDRLDSGTMWISRSYGDRVKIRPRAGLSVSDRRFAPEPGTTYAPTDRRRVIPSLGLLIWRPRYERVRFIHDLGRTEDLQIGSWASLGAGLSHLAFGSDRSFGVLQAQISPHFKPLPNSYAFISLYLGARRGRSAFTNLVSHAELTTYLHVREIHTLGLRVRFDALARPEDASQLLLGLETGLRGYAPRRFDGTRRFIANVEARPVLYRHPGFVLASVLFLDAGKAWTPGLARRSISAAAGAGARVGLARVYHNPVLRADLAYGFTDRAWQVSVGVGQYF
ncbi:MAG: POTRA domain-containing protein [Candidatus Latescibacteria bacterium]|nr:POTRA domain-containing protein [Candidatus Latescibacterota bacterium]